MKKDKKSLNDVYSILIKWKLLINGINIISKFKLKIDILFILTMFELINKIIFKQFKKINQNRIKWWYFNNITILYIQKIK